MTATTREARPAPPPPPAPIPKRRWLTPRVLVLLGIGLPTLMIALVMSGLIASVAQRSSFPFLDIDIQWPAILWANTPTGGDMGAHVYLPQYLKDELLPSLRVFGWSNDWYAGFPALYFYFPLPALVTVLLDGLLPYGVAFKLVASAGLVAFPAGVYYFVRKMGFGRAVSAIATVTGSMYVFMESFSIFGGNIKSTMAGEFSFSWSLTLSLVYLGIVMRDTREERGFTPAAGVVLALTALSHIVTTIVIVVASLPLLFRRSGPRTLTRSWILGFALAAFWAIPFAWSFFQELTTDMGWFPVQGMIGEGIAPGTVATPLPNEFIPIAALAIVGLLWTIARRDDISVLLTMTVLPVFFYWLFQTEAVEFTLVYNARLLPYWYLGGFIFAGLAIGLAVTKASRWLPVRDQNLAIGGALALLVIILTSSFAVHDVPGWVRWNYSGYEAKTDYAEYNRLMAAVDELPPGRIMWEANNEMNKYGTPMALMLFPFWSEGHPSMEGLYFESSITTPFHFLNAAEVSERPSNPVRGLDYKRLDFDRAIPHLQLYNVTYYVSYTETGRREAELAGLEMLAEPSPWTVFRVPESRLVDVAVAEPVVWDGGGAFLDPALTYYGDVENLDYLVVADGPEEWRRVTDLSERLTAIRATGAPANAVSDIVLTSDRIEFSTTAVGVPHLVKVSYFPNWTAEGADGPYRAAPSVMVVVPTEENVVLEFSRNGAEYLGIVLTLGGIATIVAYARSRRRLSAVRESK